MSGTSLPCWCDRPPSLLAPDTDGTPHLWARDRCPADPVPEPPRVDPTTQALQAIAVGLADLGQAVAEIRDLVATKNGMTTVGTLAGRRDPILPVERIEEGIRACRARGDGAEIRGDGWSVTPGDRDVFVTIDLGLLP